MDLEEKDSLVPGKSEVEEWLSERSRMIASDSAKEMNKSFSDIEVNHNGNIFFPQRLVDEAGVEFKGNIQNRPQSRSDHPISIFVCFPDFHSFPDLKVSTYIQGQSNTLELLTWGANRQRTRLYKKSEAIWKHQIQSRLLSIFGQTLPALHPPWFLRSDEGRVVCLGATAKNKTLQKK